MPSRICRPAPISSTRGLLRWRDLRAAFDAIKASAGLQVQGARLTEVPGGVSLHFASPSGFVTAPLTVTYDDEDNATITPGLIYGGNASFVVPTVGGQDLLENRVIANAGGFIYLELEWRHTVSFREYGRSPGGSTPYLTNYYSASGIELLSAEVVDYSTSQTIGNVPAATWNQSTGAVTNGTWRLALYPFTWIGYYSTSGGWGAHLAMRYEDVSATWLLNREPLPPALTGN